MLTIKWATLRQILSSELITKENGFTPSFSRQIHVTAVATWLGEIAADQKVSGSIPGGYSGGHHYKNSVGKHATGKDRQGTIIAPTFAPAQ